MGDHQSVLADFTQASLLSVNLPCNIQPAARCLNSQVTWIRDKYIKDLEEKFEQGQFLERWKKIAQEQSYSISREAEEALEMIDKVMLDLMLSAEKYCRKMYANHYRFNPPVKLWLNRCHLYRALIQMKAKMKKKGTTNPKKTNMNMSNIFQAVEQCGINNG